MASAAVTKRIEKFIAECDKEGVAFANNDRARILKGTGLVNQLIEEMGEENIPGASFKEIMECVTGCGIQSLENYAAKMDKEAGARFQASLPSNEKKEEASPAVEPKEPEAKETPVEKEYKKEAARETKSPEDKEPKKEPTKKTSRKAADTDYMSILGEHKSVGPADREKIRELKKSLYLLERQKNIISRGITIYRKDFNFLSSLDRYAKTYPAEVAGVKIDGMLSIMHAASLLLLKELAAGDNAELIEAIRENSDAREDDLKELDGKIEEVKKELEKYS